MYGFSECNDNRFMQEIDDDERLPGTRYGNSVYVCACVLSLMGRESNHVSRVMKPTQTQLSIHLI